jgi:hypothetical protein
MRSLASLGMTLYSGDLQGRSGEQRTYFVMNLNIYRCSPLLPSFITRNLSSRPKGGISWG